MTETRQETAAEYLRAAAVKVHHVDFLDLVGDELAEAIADWLDFVAHDAERTQELDLLSVEKGLDLPYYSLSLAVAAAVLGRSWPS